MIGKFILAFFIAAFIELFIFSFFQG